MSERITQQRLETVVMNIAKASSRLGINPPQGQVWALTHGSKRNGIAYKLNWNDAKHVPPRAGGFDDYLGMTSTEAHATLLTILNTLQFVEHSRCK